MAIGSVATITQGSAAHSLFALSVPGRGRPADQPVLIQEQITSPGVDLTRYRDRAFDFPTWQFIGWAAYSTYQAAIAAARVIERGWWQAFDLNWTLAGSSETWYNVKMLAVPRLEIIRGYASDATGTSDTTGALMVISADCQCTESNG